MNPTATQPRFLSVAETAKLIRASLSRMFPGIKFSVRSSTFSMGSAVDVHWTAGPDEGIVQSLLDTFTGDFEVDGESVVVPQSRFLTANRSQS